MLFGWHISAYIGLSWLISSHRILFILPTEHYSFYQPNTFYNVTVTLSCRSSNIAGVLTVFQQKLKKVTRTQRKKFVKTFLPSGSTKSKNGPVRICHSCSTSSSRCYRTSRAGAKPQKHPWHASCAVSRQIQTKQARPGEGGHAIGLYPPHVYHTRDTTTSHQTGRHGHARCDPRPEAHKKPRHRGTCRGTTPRAPAGRGPGQGTGHAVDKPARSTPRFPAACGRPCPVKNRPAAVFKRRRRRRRRCAALRAHCSLARPAGRGRQSRRTRRRTRRPRGTSLGLGRGMPAAGGGCGAYYPFGLQLARRRRSYSPTAGQGPRRRELINY
jgi:hypothetical protein